MLFNLLLITDETVIYLGSLDFIMRVKKIKGDPDKGVNAWTRLRLRNLVSALKDIAKRTEENYGAYWYKSTGAGKNVNDLIWYIEAMSDAISKSNAVLFYKYYNAAYVVIYALMTNKGFFQDVLWFKREFDNVIVVWKKHQNELK